MPVTVETKQRTAAAGPAVRPSVVPSDRAGGFTLEQQLEPFGAWVGQPIWAPPKDASVAMAKTMLAQTRPFASKQKRWEAVVHHHRSEFTQVREIELLKASIRLPKGRFFVGVTEREDFDKITDAIPACVQTRLEEFLEKHGDTRGVRVYYLKPLCVDFCDHLVLTTRDDVHHAIQKVQEEVFAEYRALAPIYRTAQAMAAVANAALAVPRAFVRRYTQNRRRAIEAYHARMEFKRRKLALSAARTHGKCRTDAGSFDEMLALTSPLDRKEVARQYCLQRELSRAETAVSVSVATDQLPWFVALSISAYAAASAFSLIGTASSIALCDPVFVAEMPDAPGELLKIGHFDEVGGVMHVEL